ncbi:MAG TPA: hypothetical protein DCX89_04325, partial [Saprospirales bacterium]|nr:hypothetical protein [Saprospirales bacterium]
MYAFGQNVRVSGQVTDAKDGMTLPGVNVQVVGTNTGAITDADGKYSIDARMGETLRFSFIGMNTTDVVVASNKLDVKMVESSLELEEVVVVGY